MPGRRWMPGFCNRPERGPCLFNTTVVKLANVDVAVSGSATLLLWREERGSTCSEGMSDVGTFIDVRKGGVEANRA